MMYYLVCLAACVAAASASCCVPPQWVGKTGTLSAIVHNGKMHTVKMTSDIVYDGLNHKIGMRESMQLDNGPGMQVDVLMDYSTNTKWIRTPNDCIKTDLGRVWHPTNGCIPGNATLIETDNTYGFSSNNISTDAYMIDAPGSRFYISVQMPGCIPVQETSRGSIDGNYFLQNRGYINMTMGIPSDVAAAIRGVPDRCQNARHVQPHYVKGLFPTSAIGVGRRSAIFSF